MSALRNAFSFSRPLARVPYALASLVLLFAPHLLVYSVQTEIYPRLEPSFGFFAMPMAFLERHNHDALMVATAVFVSVLAPCLLVMLAARRARDAGVSGWWAIPVIAPVIQAAFVLILCALPSRVREPSENPATRGLDLITAVEGLLAGMGLTLGAVVLGALVFATYGVGMFVASPLIIGAVTGFLANRRGDIGEPETVGVVAGATALGGVALLGAALEGLVCLLLAWPLGIGFAIVGGFLGRSITLAWQRSAYHSLAGVALLPVVFASDLAFQTPHTFETDESVVIAAPAAAVWQALVAMEPLDPPTSLVARLGLAYPMSATVEGEGIGATRIGMFSTGPAEERVTGWEPERRFAFAVVREPAALRELSPYAHVHAPHVHGYFKTLTTNFEIVPLPDGRTRLDEHTTHSLKLDPMPYWMPLARRAIHDNNRRVLDHISRQAERSVVRAG